MSIVSGPSKTGYALVSVWLTFILLPFAWIVSIAFKTQIAILLGQLTFTPVWTNFDVLLWGKSSEFLLSLKNSTIIALISTILVLTLSSMAVFTLFRLRVPGHARSGC